MNKIIFVKALFLIGSIAIIVGAWYKILHSENADLFLSIGLVLIPLFTISALYEIHTSARINMQEKVMWTIGLLFMNTLAGLLYVFIRRPRVIKDENQFEGNLQ